MIRRLLASVPLFMVLCTCPAATPPELVDLQQQYAFLLAERVTAPYETGVAALNEKFLAALTQAEDEARKAGNLPEVLAFEEDRKLIQKHQPPPEKDDETTPTALKKLRAVYHAETARLAQQRTASQAALLLPYTANLQALESTLTKASRLDEAKKVMQYREGLAVMLAPTVAGSQFTNSLGMKFVKVPGTDVFFCIHEVRRKDYAVYAGEAPGVDGGWKTVNKDGTPTSDQDDHPVAGIDWRDAQGFCDWLSKREGRAYRLPTDREWSCAVGLDGVEKWEPSATPEMLNGKVRGVFPWGNEYPPKGRGIGNYADTAWKTKFPKSPSLEGYTDGFATAAPVMSFKPNKLGIYDLGGNVWEWLATPFSPAADHHALRGASWDCWTYNHTLSSSRVRNPYRRYDYGFRLALEKKAR